MILIGETQVLGRKPVPFSVPVPLISYGLARD